MMRFTGRRSKAAGVTATAAFAVGALILCGAGGGTPHSAMRASLAGSDIVCSPAGPLPPPGVLPIAVGGILPAPGYCPGAQGGSAPQVPNGQQGQQCQLTEAQQQELVARAQDQQAASDLLFQSTLLKNLLSQATLKAGAAVLLGQLSGKTGLSPQDVASLIQNGSVTPADMATAILQTLQELGESSGDTAIDTCAGMENSAGAAANSSGDNQAGGQSGSNEPPQSSGGTVTPQDALTAAANPDVDLSKITPAPVWRTDNDTLYRFEDRTPDVVFKEGFQPQDVNGQYDISGYVLHNEDSPYVSTTRDPGLGDVSRGFEYDQYRYTINAPNGIDVNNTLGSENPTAWEQEVLFPGGIDTKYIVGAYERDPVTGQFDKWIANENYAGS
jgi:hypothetical protein